MRSGHVSGRTFSDMRAWRFTTGFGAVGALLPGAFLAGSLVMDMLFPTWISPPLVIAVPVLAVATSGVVGSAVFTVLSAMASFLMVVMEGWSQMQHVFYAEMIALAVVFAVSLFPGYVRSRRERAMERLLSVVETVQRAVLPPIPVRDGLLRVSAEYLPANKEAHIGGDLYEILETPYGMRMIIGDVRGKGLPAVASANNLLGAFREAAPYAATLPELAERLDDSVRRYNKRARLDAEEFITATLVSVPSWPKVEFLCCGHPGPLLIRAGQVTQLAGTQPAPPLGMTKLTTADCQVDTATFEVGDELLLYTDGITEARNAAGGFYSLDSRVKAWANGDPDQLVRNIVADLYRHTAGRLDDDAALLATLRVDRELSPDGVRAPGGPARVGDV